MISIIIATLNEEEGIAKTICSIPEDIRKEAEVIVVDVSSDMTPIIAERLGATVLRPGKKGKGWQMRYAARHSKGDILIFMDGDGTDPGGYIPQMLQKLETCDLVLGCRSGQKMEGEDVAMRQVFKLYSVFPAIAFRSLKWDVADPLAGFRAIRRKDWDRLDLQSDHFEIETEMDYKADSLGFKVTEVRIPNLKRCGGALSSKFFSSPHMWLKIMKIANKYQKETQHNGR